MNAIDLKARWRRGEASPGLWMSLTDITAAEMIGMLGLDWVAIDSEHVAMDLGALQNLVIALGDTPTIVRVPGNDPIHIKRVLDLGAAGVIVPHIRNAAEARQAVAACKYPPLGIRGTGPRRPSRYGLDERAYLARANDQTIVMIMIETIDVINDIDAVLEVEGLDAFMFGAVDLSASMGLLPAFDDARVLEAINSVIARAADYPIGMASGRSPDADPGSAFSWANLFRQGLRIIPIASDQGLIMAGAQAMLEVFHAHSNRGGR